MQRLVPSHSNRSTLPDGRSSGGNTVGKDNADQSVAAIAEPFLDKDATVEQKDRGLGQVDGRLVKDLCNVEHLGHVSSKSPSQKYKSTYLESLELVGLGQGLDVFSEAGIHRHHHEDHDGQSE